MKLKKIIGTSVVLVFSCLLVTGCNSSKKQESGSSASSALNSSENEKISDKKENKKLKAIGTKTGHSDEYEKKIDNQTGKEIKAVFIKNMTEESFGDSLLKESDIFKENEKRILYFSPESENESKDSSSENAKFIIPGYDLSFETIDGAKFTIFGFPFDDLKEASLHIKDDVAYIEYKSISTDEQVNTYETQKAAKELDK